MNPEPNNVDNTEVKKEKHPVFQVTKTSKYLAMLLFILLPFVGGWIGYTYAPEKVVEVAVAPLVQKTEKKLVAEFSTPNPVYSPLADGDYRPRWYQDENYFYCEGGKGVSEARFELPVEIEFTAISDSPDQFMVRDASPSASDIWIRNEDRMFGTIELREVSTEKVYNMNCTPVESNVLVIQSGEVTVYQGDRVEVIVADVSFDAATSERIVTNYKEGERTVLESIVIAFRAEGKDVNYRNVGVLDVTFTDSVYSGDDIVIVQ